MMKNKSVPRVPVEGRNVVNQHQVKVRVGP